MNSDNTSGMAAVFDASREAHKPEVIGVVRGDMGVANVLVIPEGMQVIDTLPMLDALREFPQRAKGTSTHQTLASIQEHVAAHRDAGTVAWLQATPTAAALTVVYNYHHANVPGEHAGQARHGDRRATYAFPVSEPWRAWQGISGKALSQADLAAFLDAHVTEIRGPADAGPRVLDIARALVGGDDDVEADTLDADALDARARKVIATPSQLLRIARRIAMHVETRAIEERDNAGNVNIVFRSEATAESTTGDEKGRVTLPQLLVVEVPVVQGGAAYKLPVRLTTRIVGQRCQWTLAVHRADLALEDAVNDAAVKFTAETGVPVFRGTPEA